MKRIILSVVILLSIMVTDGEGIVYLGPEYRGAITNIVNEDGYNFLVGQGVNYVRGRGVYPNTSSLIFQVDRFSL